jgi:amino acid transporter
MEFMGIAVGILALICTAVLLFGVRGTRKILGWLVLLAVLGIGGTLGFVAWSDNQAKRQANVFDQFPAAENKLPAPAQAARPITSDDLVQGQTTVLPQGCHWVGQSHSAWTCP